MNSFRISPKIQNYTLTLLYFSYSIPTKVSYSVMYRNNVPIFCLLFTVPWSVLKRKRQANILWFSSWNVSPVHTACYTVYMSSDDQQAWSCMNIN